MSNTATDSAISHETSPSTPGEWLESTVANLVVQRPTRAAVFEKYGLDFCCKGNQTLEHACRTKQLEAGMIINELVEQDHATDHNLDATDWTQVSLTELSRHIVATHHHYLTNTLPQLETMTAKLAHVHRTHHPELPQIHETFVGMKKELESHMMKEEMILFPAIQRMETGSMSKSAAHQLLGPMSVMLAEHESAGAALERMRSLSSDFALPADACNTYRATYELLQELERDLHIHIHKENNILFPRALDSDELYNQIRIS